MHIIQQEQQMRWHPTGVIRTRIRVIRVRVTRLTVVLFRYLFSLISQFQRQEH